MGGTYSVLPPSPVAKVKRPHTKFKYPFREMKVNESFKFPVKDRVKIRSAAFDFCKDKEVRFASRKISEQEYQIWRIK